MNSAKHSNVLPAPSVPEFIPEALHWLAGEGCGSWFSILLVGENYEIRRYSPDGKIECAGLFEIVTRTLFDINSDFSFTYLSHCSEVNILQQGNVHKFRLIEKLIHKV